MNRLILLSALAISLSSGSPFQKGGYMFIMLRPIPACEGKCNNFELLEFPKNNAEECRILQDSLTLKYGNTPTYYCVAPGEAVIYYKYNKFVTNCDCRILGIHKSASVAQATEEMKQKVAEEKAKKPKAYHNYEVYGWWPR